MDNEVNSMVNGNDDLLLTNSKSIVDRLRVAAGVNTDKELALFLGINKQNVTSAKKRGIPPLWIIKIGKQFGYSLDWLAFGEGPKKRVDKAEEGQKRPPVDSKLLENIITALEGGLERRGLTMDPDKKAQAVSLLYELYADTQKEVTEETVVRYLKLVA